MRQDGTGWDGMMDTNCISWACGVLRAWFVGMRMCLLTRRDHVIMIIFHVFKEQISALNVALTNPRVHGRLSAKTAKSIHMHNQLVVRIIIKISISVPVELESISTV